MFRKIFKKKSFKITKRQSTIIFAALKQLENNAERYRIDKDVQHLKNEMIKFNK